ncbi:MAG: hypothetical protein ACK5TK_09555 [Betaproteobacteria bacterium]
MTLAPGSWLWLARHEARLIWRAGAGKSRRAQALLLAAIVVGLHLLLWPAVAAMPLQAPSAGPGAALGAYFATASLLFMFGNALLLTVAAYFERGDFDLLLSSPIAPRTVLIVRTLVVAGTVIAGNALYLLPLANVGLLLGRNWLGSLYLSLPVAGLLAAGGGAVAALALVRAIGARRTRTLVQVAGIATGAAMYLVAQTGMLANLERPDARVAPWLEPVLGWTFSFAIGRWPALPLGAALAALVCALAWAGLSRTFLRGALGERTAGGRRGPRGPARLRPLRWPTLELWRKEWRVVRREPLLLARIGYSLVFFLPLVFIALRGERMDTLQLVVLASVAAFGAGSLAGQLARLTVDVEDAPDLLYAAPRPPSRLLLHKGLVAAALGAGCALLLTAFVLPQAGPRLLWGVPFALGAAASCALTIAANPRPVRRDDLTTGRVKDFDLERTVVNGLLMALWSAAAGLALGTAPGWGLLLAAVGLPHLATEWRQLHRHTASTAARARA